jgi:arginine exporter protein ArgO
MENSSYIARLIGPACIAITVSELLNLRIFENPNPHLVYLNGTLLLIAGLAIVRAHNRWVFDWTVLITLVGWIGVLGGLGRMFFPEAQKEVLFYVVAASIFTLLIIGIVLTFKAYIRDI